MNHRFGFGAVAFAAALLSANAAMADASRCGDVPFPPEVPSAGAMAKLPPQDAQTARHQAFEDVISWQKGLKTYRGCLDTLRDDDDRKIAGDRNGSKDDQSEIKGLQDDEANINVLYDKTVDTEKTIVGGFTGMTQAYCSRKDVDLSACQQTK